MQIKSHTKRKQDLGLTVTAATTQARRIVDRVMPGAGATVESRLSHDLATDTATVITVVTFPRNDERTDTLIDGLTALPGKHGAATLGDSSIVITRSAR